MTLENPHSDHPLRLMRYNRTVEAAETDENGHVNNVSYVRWMQEAGTHHSAALGWTVDRYQEIGRGWFVRRHLIDYFRPAFEGQQIEVLTWIHSFERVRSKRRYVFLGADQKPLVTAETDWVFVDLKSGKARPVPPEMAADFPLLPESEAPLHLS